MKVQPYGGPEFEEPLRLEKQKNALMMAMQAQCRNIASPTAVKSAGIHPSLNVLSLPPQTNT